MSTALPNSTYLDYDSYRSAPAPLTGNTPVPAFVMNVALVFDRANDPTALLNADWASRQQQIAALNGSGSLWSTYGANQANFDQVASDLATMGIQTFYTPGGPANQQYVSSAESRTLWIQLDQNSFTSLFGTPLVQGTDQSGNTTWYWQGSLSLPDSWVATLGVKGLWFDTQVFENVLPNPGTGTAAPLLQGAQSPGNGAGSQSQTFFPQQIAADYFNYPLKGALWNPASGVAPATGTIGLVEPGIGTAVPSGSFQALIDAYRSSAGINTSAVVTTVAGGGEPTSNSGERSLDVGIVTATNPQSPLVLYAGSGDANGAMSEAYTAYQSAFWDTVNNPEVVTSSFRFLASQMAPNSPFLFAARELFVDAALRNITALSSAGDGGSGYLIANGLPNVSIPRDSPYGLVVGGTSLSTMAAAQADLTLANILGAAQSGDPGTIWALVSGGLMTMPSAAGAAQNFIETVWNRYTLNNTTFGNGSNGGYFDNLTGGGGVDGTQPIPSYQSAFGLTPTSADPSAQIGRGLPDVSAPAGGNMFYTVPEGNMAGLHGDGGTSAATPFWAALISQINTIFGDQNLPHLGYMNDLLYIAAAIAPASFNDITVGTNTSSFVLGGSYTSDGTAITPTGYGYSAGPGYDLASGLGTPNGVLLARALTAIAHAQTSFSSSPDMLDANGGGWTSGAGQSLLFQPMSGAATYIDIGIGGGSIDFSSFASGSFAWTARFAQQAMQPDFDPALVRMFDKYGLGATAQGFAGAGDALSVQMNGGAGAAVQGSLSSAFGFADFYTADGAVRVARPVAVAETAGGANDQQAVLRLRQGGEDSLSLTLYRVDDLGGTIGGLQPGDPGYASAAQARAYQLASGGTSIGGPGYGNYTQTTLLHVDAGDIIAMVLTNQSKGDTYWAFSQANEQVGGQPVGHLWNFGLNTWGWEDTRGGGDHDFNDLVVQLDFTSASGHGWLV